MATDIRMEPVRFYDHCHGVPAHVTLDAPLDLAVARVRRLPIDSDRIDVGAADRMGNLKARLPQAVDQFDKEGRLFWFLVPENILQDIFQRSDPLLPAIAAVKGIPVRYWFLFRFHADSLVEFVEDNKTVLKSIQA